MNVNGVEIDVYTGLFICFCMNSIFTYILVQYYLETMEKRNCDCSKIEKLKIIKYILMCSVVVWIALIIIMHTNNIIISPLLTVGVILLFGYVIYGLIYFYNSTYDCKCAVSRIGSILGYFLIVFVVTIPAMIYFSQDAIKQFLSLEYFNNVLQGFIKK